MIVSFGDKNTKKLFEGQIVKGFRSFERSALRKLEYLEAAHQIEDLRSPPGNRLEALRGDRKGQYSIRINQQWRVCFRWTDRGAEDVEIVDYH